MERQLQGTQEEALQTTETEGSKQHCVGGDQTAVGRQRKEEEHESQEKIDRCTNAGSGVGGSTDARKSKDREERGGHHGSRG